MYHCQMLRFLIEQQIPISQNREKLNETELKLDDEWTMKCFMKDNRLGRNQPTDIHICRLNTFQEVSIFGTVTVHRYYPQFFHESSTLEFSKLLAPGSAYIDIPLNKLQFVPCSKKSCVINTSLSGTIYIVFSREKYLCANSNTDCDNCIKTKSLVKLSNDFERLLDPQSPCLTDVNLKCGDALIPAHKIILSTRSPVFAAMFSKEMKEKHENQVNITDIDELVVRAKINYIYTGNTSSLTLSSAPDLLFAADKYQLDYLKTVCCEFLKENMTLQNVLNTLVLGNMHAEDLKCYAVDYICENCADFSVVEKTEEWKILKKNQPDLTIEVLTALVKSRDKESKAIQADPAHTHKIYGNARNYLSSDESDY